MAIGSNFSATEALVRAKELAHQADTAQERNALGDLPRATAAAAVATALASIATAMRDEAS